VALNSRRQILQILSLAIRVFFFPRWEEEDLKGLTVCHNILYIIVQVSCGEVVELPESKRRSFFQLWGITDIKGHDIVKIAI